MTRIEITGLPEYRLGRRAEYNLLIVLFRLFMDYSYAHVVGTTYAYMGFDNNPSFLWMLLSWLILMAGSQIVYKAYLNEEKRISFEVILFLYIMSFVPFTSMIGFGALQSDFILFNIIFWTLVLLLCVTFASPVRGTSLKLTGEISLSDFHLKLLALMFGIVVLYISGRYAHFRLNFNLLNVYEFRADAAENNLPMILTYAFSWSRTLNSILLAYFIRQKKKAWATGCVLIQLLSFGYDGSKSTFFLLILAIGINLFPRIDMDMLNKWALRGVTMVAGLCVLFFAVTGNFIPISVIIRRVFFLPVRIAKDYFAFFTTNTPDYFRQSFLRYFHISSPYSMSIPYLIADVYFGNAGMSANNGLISDAVANLGYAGIFIFPFLYSFIFKWLDRSSIGLDPRIYLTVGIYLSTVMTNSFIFTILLTHGLIVAMIVLLLMRRDAGIVNMEGMEGIEQ